MRQPRQASSPTLATTRSQIDEAEAQIKLVDEQLSRLQLKAPFDALVTAGDYVFVVTDPTSDNLANTLIAYKRAADGNLSVAGFVRDTQADSAGKTVSMADPKYLAVSADGQLLYVAGASSVQVLRFNAVDGNFTSLGALVSDLSKVSDIALSANGELLYLSSADGDVQRIRTFCLNSNDWCR